MAQKEVVDIRILRSKKAISDTLMGLLNERDFKTITITEIVNKAGVNRGTFYKHYAYKEDVLQEIQDDFLEQLATMLENNYQDVCYSSLKTVPLSDALFTFIYDHRDFFHLVIHTVGFLHFQMQFSAVLKDFLIENFFPTAHHSFNSHDPLAAYVANGIYGYLAEWDENAYTSSPTEMAQQLTDIFILDRSVFSLPVVDLVTDEEFVD